jgi:hypothetical protein
MALLTELARNFVETPLISTIANLPVVQSVGTSYSSDNFHPLFISRFGSYQYQITGTVKNSSLAFVARTVIAADRDTGIIYDKVISDPTTGSFTLNVPNVTCVVYCLPDPADGVNAEIFDLITPTI